MKKLGSGVKRSFPSAAVWRRGLILLGAVVATGGWLRAQPIVEGGSPFYVFAVRDALQGLRKTAAASPQAGQAARGAAAAAAATPAGVGAGAARTNAVRRWTPTPEFLARYYFCTNCQAWHLRPTPLTTLQQRMASNAAPSLMLSRTNPAAGASPRPLARPPGTNGAPATPGSGRTKTAPSPGSP